MLNKTFRLFDKYCLITIANYTAEYVAMNTYKFFENWQIEENTSSYLTKKAQKKISNVLIINNFRKVLGQNLDKKSNSEQYVVYILPRVCSSVKYFQFYFHSKNKTAKKRERYEKKVHRLLSIYFFNGRIQFFLNIKA